MKHILLKTLLLSILWIIGVNSQYRCRTPRNLNGICKSIYECIPLRNMLTQQPLTQEVIKFLRRSQCAGSSDQPFVCCPDAPTQVLIPQQNSKRRPFQISQPSNGRGRSLPEEGFCGNVPTSKKLYGGQYTDIDEFPWMAVLEYQRPNGSWSLNCGGALINERYVITAAHCVKGEIEKAIGRLINVRLGEYDTDTDTDCVIIGKTRDCADPHLNFGIEEIIPHPGYSSLNRNRVHDIALIRLSGNVKYSDFVQPICLPSGNFQRSLPNDKLYVAGWGRTLYSRRSPIKQKLIIPVFDHKECVNKYLSKNAVLEDSHLCAGGKFAEDSCDGDSGGPLMKLTNYWTVEGIISFGNRCGLEGWPGVYTRVSSYMDWINSKLRP